MLEHGSPEWIVIIILKLQGRLLFHFYLERLLLALFLFFSLGCFPSATVKHCSPSLKNDQKCHNDEVEASECHDQEAESITATGFDELFGEAQ